MSFILFHCISFLKANVKKISICAQKLAEVHLLSSIQIDFLLL